MANPLEQLFGGGGDEINYTPTPLDQGSQGLIDTKYQQSLQSPEQAIAKRQAVISESPNLMTQSNDETSLAMGGTGGLSKAIFQRQAKRRGEGIARLQTRAELGGINDSMNDQNDAFNAQLAAQKIKNRNNEMLWKASAANAEARAAVMRNLLGVGGMLAGAAIAGPQGAMIGGAVANSAGGKPADPNSLMASNSSVSESFASPGMKETWRREGDFKSESDSMYMPRIGKGDGGY